MDSRSTRHKQFAQHYKILELDDNAGWNVVRGNYRRLVHQWHPDRFAHRPRERVNAQRNFITVTKSYNELRQFFRQHGQLPLQSAIAATQTPGAQSDSVAEQPVEAIFGRDPEQHSAYDKSSLSWKKVIWFALGSAVMLVTIVGFLLLDKRASQSIQQQGREIIKETPPSDFMPSSEEIRRSQTRGAFVRPTQ